MSAADRLLYREDDDNFKKRLNSAIQLAWVYNTALTILVCVVIFHFLGYNLAFGIILGILMALFANFHYTLIQITKTNRWEIYRNRVVMPKGIRGGDRTIGFEDIEGIERKDGITGKRAMIRLTSGETINISVEEQEMPVKAMIMAYRQHARVKARRASDISMLTVSDEGEGQNGR